MIVMILCISSVNIYMVCLRCISVSVTVHCLFVCLSSNVVSTRLSPAAVSAVGQCMFKKSALNHYHLSRSLRLSLSHPLMLCVFPFLFPCGAEVMCFGTVRQLLDKALENDLSINVPSAPQHGWWEKEWEYSQSQGWETHEREGRGQSSGNVFTLQAFCTGSSAALIRLPKKPS